MTTYDLICPTRETYPFRAPPWVRWTINDTSDGIGLARNNGARQLDHVADPSDWFVFTDDDTELCYICPPPPDGADWALPTYFPSWGGIEANDTYQTVVMLAANIANLFGPFPIGLGPCIAVRRSAFWKVGGFDERPDFPLEDWDLTLKLSEAGFKREPWAARAYVYRATAPLAHARALTRAGEWASARVEGSGV